MHSKTQQENHPKPNQKHQIFQLNDSIISKLAAVSAEREMETIVQKGNLWRRSRTVESNELVETEEAEETRFHEEVWEIGERTKSSLLHHWEMRHYASLLDR
ncbi:hypothetical protein Rs2_22699 [Raphanus sativus]|nr:hypothetical protein Rs2_22699 [Raphanus sativus]